MGKKRKASGRPFGQANSQEDAPQKTKLAINTYEDVADSGDEFHLGRDKILLDEGPDAKRRRKWKEQDEFLEQSDEEVLAESDLDEEEESLDEDALESDEEDSGSEDSNNSGEEEEDVDGEGWGSSKRDYYDADAIETEQDALEEEVEAARLQKLQLSKLSEADFFPDDIEWGAQAKAGDSTDAEEKDVIIEKLPQLRITAEMSSEEKSDLLKRLYPEFEPLKQEFLQLNPIHDELKLAADAAQRIKKAGANTPGPVAKYWAVASYLSAIAMYFAIFSSPSDSASSKGQDTESPVALSPEELHAHPIMEELAKCKQLWERVKDIQFPNQPMEEEVILDEEPDNILVQTKSKPIVDGALPSKDGLSKTQKRKKSKAARLAAAIAAEAEARRAERMQRVEEELADLSELTAKRSSKLAQPTKSGVPFTLRDAANDEDLGEELPLTAAEAAAKAARKKSLRFYTSQIAQKANKRDRAGRGAGGDEDLPYRERLRDRQARLNAEAERRGKTQKPDELGGDSDDDDRRVAKDVRGDDDEEDYYQTITSRNSAKKADKVAKAAAIAAAGINDRIIETEAIGPDGKRAISYQIAKNKGLTPHRKKESRNPRVKKRMQFAEKKKKLGSVRAVYKGGEGKGGYGGELTGIKKGLVRGVKL